MNKTIISVPVVIILAVGGFFVFHKSSSNNSTTTPNTTTPSTTTPASPSANQTAAATITYSDKGFSPSSVTVKAGDKVMINNTSSQAVQVQSNPHPVHTDDSDLNVGAVGAGKSTTFTVSQKGTFGYHNHLDPAQGGTITIQ